MRVASGMIGALALVVCGACGSDGGAAGGTDAGDGAGDGETLAACGDTTLRAVPADPGARGPWPVGARTVTVAGLTVEVWYPAEPGSESGKAAVTYDLREQLPAAEKNKIPDEENPLQGCDCYRDLPLDGAFGPYPVVVFVHGTAAFRTQTATQMTHWASRGFVVLAADHPGIRLADVLAGSFGSNQAAEAAQILDALEAPSGDLAFLADRIDPDRIALSGHSAGGGAIAGFGSRAGVQVLMPLASQGVDPGASLRSTLIMGGMDDGIARYDGQQSAYEAAPAPKRLVGLTGAGHLAFSDLCFIGRDEGGILEIATRNGVTVNPLVAALARDGCQPDNLSAEAGWAIIDHVTAGVLEETLHCRAEMTAALAATEATFADVGEYREALE